MIMITEPDQLKGNAHTHTFTHRPLHLCGLSRPQIREGWCSHNPFTNVWRFKWAPDLPQPKQISGTFCGPRPPWFGWRMCKTSFFFPLTSTTENQFIALSKGFSSRCLPEPLHYCNLHFSTTLANIAVTEILCWERCPQLGFTQQHQCL